MGKKGVLSLFGGIGKPLDIFRKILGLLSLFLGDSLVGKRLYLNVAGLLFNIAELIRDRSLLFNKGGKGKRKVAELLLKGRIVGGDGLFYY
ncbi:MAG: hypothetical protein IJW27_04945 [Clostridia bacterium]|nr:hypothetical protein [Clostridia bacterium]